MKLLLKNNLTNTSVPISCNDDGSSGYYWVLSFVIPNDMPDGEYNFELYDDDDNLLSTGIAQIGDYSLKNNAYNSDEKIITYNG